MADTDPYVAAAEAIVSTTEVPNAVAYMRPTPVGHVPFAWVNPFRWRTQRRDEDEHGFELQRQGHATESGGEAFRRGRGHERVFMYRIVVHGSNGTMTIADMRRAEADDVWTWVGENILPAAHAIADGEENVSVADAALAIVEAVHTILANPAPVPAPAPAPAPAPEPAPADPQTYAEIIECVCDALSSAEMASDTEGRVLAENLALSYVRQVVNNLDVISITSLRMADANEIRDPVARGAFNDLYRLWSFKWDLGRLVADVSDGDVWLTQLALPVIMLRLAEAAAMWLETLNEETVLTPAMQRVLSGVLVYGDDSDVLLVPSILYRIARVTEGRPIEYQNKLALCLQDVLSQVVRDADQWSTDSEASVKRAEWHLLYLQRAIDIRKVYLRSTAPPATTDEGSSSVPAGKPQTSGGVLASLTEAFAAHYAQRRVVSIEVTRALEEWFLFVDDLLGDNHGGVGAQDRGARVLQLATVIGEHNDDCLLAFAKMLEYVARTAEEVRACEHDSLDADALRDVYGDVTARHVELILVADAVREDIVRLRLALQAEASLQALADSYTSLGADVSVVVSAYTEGNAPLAAAFARLTGSVTPEDIDVSQEGALSVAGDLDAVVEEATDAHPAFAALGRIHVAISGPPIARHDAIIADAHAVLESKVQHKALEKVVANVCTRIRAILEAVSAQSVSASTLDLLNLFGISSANATVAFAELARFQGAIVARQRAAQVASQQAEAARRRAAADEQRARLAAAMKARRPAMESDSE